VCGHKHQEWDVAIISEGERENSKPRGGLPQLRSFCNNPNKKGGAREKTQPPRGIVGRATFKTPILSAGVGF